MIDNSCLNILTSLSDLFKTNVVDSSYVAEKGVKQEIYM